MDFFFFYFGTGLSGEFSWDRQASNHYSYLAEGFLSGKLSLSIQPKAELLALPNPFDPKANALSRLHDASLYNGKYYLYFGPVPALLFYAPIKLVFQHYPSDSFVVFVCLMLGTTCLVLLLFLAKDRWYPGVSESLLCVLAFSLAFGAGQNSIFVRPTVYEVAIATGFLLAVVAFFFLYLSRFDKKGYLLLVGLCFGLAVGARAHLALIGLALFPWLMFRIKGYRSLYLILPALACGLMYLLYNYLRFGEAFEFGARYQLMGHIGNSNFYSFLHASWQVEARNFFHIFLRPPRFDHIFPYIHPVADLHHRMDLENVSGEPLLGILWSAPLFLLSFIPYRGTSLKAKSFATLPFLYGIFLTVFYCLWGMNARYYLEFVPFLVFAGLLKWMSADGQRRGKNWLDGLCVLAAFYSGLLGLLSSF